MDSFICALCVYLDIIFNISNTFNESSGSGEVYSRAKYPPTLASKRNSVASIMLTYSDCVVLTQSHKPPFFITEHTVGFHIKVIEKNGLNIVNIQSTCYSKIFV